MCKFTYFLFTMFMCDGKVGRGDLVGGTLQMGTGELTSTPKPTAAWTCCHNCPEDLLNGRLANDWVVLNFHRAKTPSESEISPIYVSSQDNRAEKWKMKREGNGVKNRKTLQKTRELKSEKMKAVMRTTLSVLNILQDVSFI